MSGVAIYESPHGFALPLRAKGKAGASLRAETEGQDEPRVEVEPDRRAILWQATAWRPCAGGSEAVNWQATLDLPRDSND